MTEVKLTYNPYTKDKSLEIDGERQNSDVTKNCCGADGTELSEWCEAFYSSILNEVNDSFTVSFNGIQRDYEFMEDALEEFKKSHSDVEVKLEKGNVVEASAALNDLKTLFAKMQKVTPFEKLKSEELKRDFDKATNSEFKMAVVATMSSGKSTLINAILGRELLPARNDATTATIAEIYGSDKDGKPLDEFKGIAFDKNGKPLSEWIKPLTAEKMEDLNTTDTKKIEIRGPIAGIESKDLRFVLIDTPGPNNAENTEHLAITMNFLGGTITDKGEVVDSKKQMSRPMIIYVLNGNTLTAKDDSHLLKNVAKLVANGDRISRDRFIFVLSHADDFEAKDPIGKMLDKAKEYLEKRNIKQPRIFPVASLQAESIRRIMNGDSPETDEKGIRTSAKKTSDRWIEDSFDDPTKQLSAYAKFLSPTTQKALEERIEKAKASGDKRELALLYTGVPSVEMAITEYLTKYALPAKISESVASFQDKIDALNIEAEETKKLDGNKAEVKRLQAQLSEIEEKLSKGDEAKELKKQIENLGSNDTYLENALAGVRRQLLANCTDKIQSMKNKHSDANHVQADEANKNLDELRLTISTLEADFTSSIEKILDEKIRRQAAYYVNEYKKYVEDLVGSVDYKLPPEAVLGDVASISINEVMNDYAFQDKVATGSHLEENSGFRAGIARFLNLDSFLWQDAYRRVTDYEMQDFVRFSDYIDKEIEPRIGKFAEDTRERATTWAEGQEKTLKDSFRKKFDNLEGAIQAKIEEKKNNLESQEATEKMIEQNNRNLKWLKDFQSELDGILSV